MIIMHISKNLYKKNLFYTLKSAYNCMIWLIRKKNIMEVTHSYSNYVLVEICKH